MINPVDSSAANKITITVRNCNTGVVTLRKGMSYKLGTIAGKSKVSYKSSKKKIASVSKKGVVKAHKNGVSTITIKAKLEKKTATKKISVKVISKKKYKKVKSIKAKVKKLKILVGDSVKSNISFNPKKASNKNLVFTSDKKDIATVSGNGQIKGESVGTAKIKVKSCDNKKATAVITVSVVAKQNESSLPT